MNIETLHATISDNLGCKSITVKDGRFYVTFAKKDVAGAKDFQVLPNFYMSEFLTRNTKDTTTILCLNVMVLIQNIRDSYGSGVGLNSTYRNPDYNRRVGGAPKSEHVQGEAIDSYPVDRDIKRYTKVVEGMNIPGGFGKYNTFVHVDVRPYRARWDERTKK